MMMTTNPTDDRRAERREQQLDDWLCGVDRRERDRRFNDDRTSEERMADNLHHWHEMVDADDRAGLL